MILTNEQLEGVWEQIAKDEPPKSLSINLEAPIALFLSMARLSQPPELKIDDEHGTYTIKFKQNNKNKEMV